MNRRQNLQLLTGAAAFATTSCYFGTGPTLAQAQSAPAATGPFKLPPLGYAYDALEPHIDATTMNIHHTRHHQSYVTAANQIAAKWDGLTKSDPETILANLDKAPAEFRTGIRNNLGGHWNHTFFWDIMTPGGAEKPSGDLKAAIDQTFGDVDKFVDRFNGAGAGRFGSGWAWLVVKKDKKLDVVSTANQDPPILEGNRAVIGVDVWEHAYYLKYQNRRPDYLKSWWNTVNWDKAAANFKKAAG